MLGRGLYTKKNKILPGIYVGRTSRQIKEGVRSIKVYAIKNNGNITLNLTSPFVFDCTSDDNGNVSLSNTYGFSLSNSHDGEGNVSMEVK